MKKLVMLYFLYAVIGVSCANAADVTLVQGGASYITIEGEISAGDTEKFIAVIRNNRYVNDVVLHSAGGDVIEAMKLGRLIRRLRLATNSEFFNEFSGQRSCHAKIAKAENCICASACFVVFAGGGFRTGNNLVLHRPFLTKEAAARYSYGQREQLQKDITVIVTNYLIEMEVPQYYVEKMMSRSSQDAYFVTHSDILDSDHPLGTPPSIEEIQLSECKKTSVTQVGKLVQSLNKSDRRTDADNKQIAKLNAEIEASGACMRGITKKLRDDAFDREFGLAKVK